MSINTALTRLLGIRVPLVLPPMAGVAGGRLAAAVYRGGGFSFLAGAAGPLSQLTNEISISRRELSLSPTDPLPIGIGLQLWRLEAPHGDPSLGPQFIEVILQERVPAIWLSFGQEMEAWVERIRAKEKELGTSRTKLFVLVGDVEAASKAAECDIDVVVGQGAGGLVNGAHLVSILPWADGGVFGTAFIPTPEALYSDKQKELVIKSSGSDTIRSEKYDIARGTLGWGDRVDGRGIKNLTSEESEESLGSEEGKRVYAEAAKAGDTSRIVTWAGSSVGLITELAPAEELVKRIGKEAVESLNYLKSLSQ
ncbi:hypothetical protein MNV49_001668 [Pseudohyphozyma bogoriensis]|nr:hypothetical protein MNV49_001668 [Pseudohyphozyma bogoriensis]